MISVCVGGGVMCMCGCDDGGWGWGGEWLWDVMRVRVCDEGVRGVAV